MKEEVKEYSKGISEKCNELVNTQTALASCKESNKHKIDSYETEMKKLKKDTRSLKVNLEKIDELHKKREEDNIIISKLREQATRLFNDINVTLKYSLASLNLSCRIFISDSLLSDNSSKNTEFHSQSCKITGLY